MRSIYIVCPDGDQRQLEAASICADHHFRRSFAGGVWVRRCENTCFAQVCRAHRHIAVYLVRRDVHEPSYAMLSGPLQQHMCPIHICICELVRVAKAEVDVRLRRKVEDGVDLVLAKHALYVGW